MDTSTNKVVTDCINLFNSTTICGSGISKFPVNFSKLRYSGSNSSIHQLLLEALIASENKVPNGSHAFMRLLISNNQDKKSSFYFKNPTNSDLEFLLERDYSTFVKDCCLTAIKLAGPTGKIIVESIDTKISNIELRLGYKFDLFSPLGNFSLKNSKIILIDGFIENISEIHHLLTQSSQTTEDLVIFVRGMSDDVLNTISLNHKRGSLFIKPIIVKFDENGINSLKDISVITKSPVVTSDLGMLISKIELSTVSMIEGISCFNNQIFIEESSTIDSVEKHRKNLFLKLKECENDFSAALYESRIKSLSSRQVFIRLPTRENYNGLKQEIDSCLRTISFKIKNGITGEIASYEEAVVYDLYESFIGVLSSKIILC